ncbi:MAG: FMN-binding protein [Lysobacterales bacterium]
MRFKFSLVPALSLAVATAAPAEELQTLKQAIDRIYPGQQLLSADFKLASRDYQRLKLEYKVPAIRSQVKAWKTDSGDWLFLDQVYGLNDIVTYLLGVNTQGSVTGLEVLTCAEGYCDSVFTPQWLDQMAKSTHGHWMPGDVVTLVSGATLSTTHIAEGVKKLLAIHARYLPQGG